MSDYTISNIKFTAPHNAVTFFCSGDEMLRCSDKGFWVRGKQVEVDDKEALTVYNSFKEWLAYQQLAR